MIGSQLEGIHGLSPANVAAALALAVATGTAASLWPALTATRVDPAVALRAE